VQILAEYASMGDFVSAQIMGHPVEMDEGDFLYTSSPPPHPLPHSALAV